MKFVQLRLTYDLVLDIIQLRVNPVGGGTSMLPPSIQNPAPIHDAASSHGPGIVNYRALLAGDTDCDYEVRQLAVFPNHGRKTDPVF
jgi:hypothetical protein